MPFPVFWYHVKRDWSSHVRKWNTDFGSCYEYMLSYKNFNRSSAQDWDKITKNGQRHGSESNAILELLEKNTHLRCTLEADQIKQG